MSKIKSQNTSLELKIFKYLRKERIYFQKHYSKVPGKPDIALPKKRRVVFIDGDFWHGRNFKQTKTRLPKVYWQSKIASNIARDQAHTKLLKKNGWKVLRIWEYHIKNKEKTTLEKVKQFLTADE